MTWLPLAEHNPVPGNPIGVGELGAYFTDQAAMFQYIADELKRLRPGMWEGEAAEAFSRRRTDLIPHLEALASRWNAGGNALRNWALAISHSREIADRALASARDAEDWRIEAQRNLDTARQEFEASLGDPTPDMSAVQWWERQVAEREADLAAARTLLAQAEELYDDGARTCEAALHHAADDSLENRGGILAGTRRRFHGIVRHFPQIKTAAKYLGLAAGALALTASMFTGVGAVAAAAFVVGGLATTLDTALMISGDGKWTTVAWDAFGLLTFGLGRAFASVARGTAATAAVEDTRVLKSAQTLKGIAAEGVRSTRPLVGAAARSRRLALYREWGAFTSEAAVGALPESRNWLRAVTFWREIRIPPPDVLNLSRDATRYAAISQVVQGAGNANDIRGVIASEQELLEEQTDSG